MSTAIAERPAETLPKDQLDLIRRTVAKDATPDELQLFLYDCARRGVHPLDKLLHFTKRGGKYTPVTSIDFMRSQAAMSGEMAGNDDPFFVEEDHHPQSATVSVYRITQGQRFAYSATARWAEYCPDNAQMWRKMPHTMLGKCAEALALRKAFPQQLAGLYAREEMEQADASNQTYVVEAPAHAAPVRELVAGNEHAKDGDPVYREAPPVPDGALFVEKVTKKGTNNPNVTKYRIHLSDGREVGTIRDKLSALAEEVCQLRQPVTVKTTHGKWGEDLLEMHRVLSATEQIEEPLDPGEPLPF